MPNSNEGRSKAEMWSLQQVASWIHSRTEAKPQTLFEIAAESVGELHDALKSGQIVGSGCVDGGERRAILSDEWYDYSLSLRYKMFAGSPFLGSTRTPVIYVLSVSPLPSAALKYQAYRSQVRVPSSRSENGEVGYHRVIADVLLPRREILQRWPAGADDHVITEPDPQSDIESWQVRRTRPSRSRARQALGDIYPNGVPNQTNEPNSILYNKVGKWLKEKHLPDVSNDTILRAAGRRRK